MKKKIMIIGVGWEQIPLILQAKEEGCEVVVTTQWKQDIADVKKTYWVDSRDIEQLEKIFLLERPDAVIADECDYSMYAVAYITEKYGMPGPGLEALTITNNKILQRRMLEGSSVFQPEFYECWNYRQVETAVESLGYPVVVKSIDNRGSIGVFIVNREEELKEAWYGAVKNSNSRKCLVEDFIEGDIITADGFCDDEKFHYIASSTKESYEGASSVAKVLYYPGKLDEKYLHAIEKACREIVEKFKICFGFVHFEFIIEKGSGKLYFVEGANRGGGVYISELVLQEITGINWKRYLLNKALGIPVKIDFKREYTKHTIMYFLETSAGSLHPEEIVNEKDSIVAMHMGIVKSDNNKKSDARERQGVVILSGKNRDALIAIARKIESQVSTVDAEYNYVITG